jgi:hypothetical protein
LLEQLQYNLEERKKLQDFAGMYVGQSWGQEVKYMGITHVTGEKEEDAHYSCTSASQILLST